MKKYKNNHHENQEARNEEHDEELEQDIENDEEVAEEEAESTAEDEVAALKAENQKLKEDFLRAYADAENIKKRCAQEIEKNNKYAPICIISIDFLKILCYHKK